MNSFIAAIEQFIRSIERNISNFFQRIIDFLKITGRWLNVFIGRVVDYTMRLIKAAFNLFKIFGKVLLLYLPALICFELSTFNYLGKSWIYISVGYIVIITCIGIFYRRQQNP
jgi:hypothetical protein